MTMMMTVAGIMIMKVMVMVMFCWAEFAILVLVFKKKSVATVEMGFIG